jgi:DNA-binding PadR family transcriptional regulator
MGRFAEPALWILVALRRGPARSAALFDAVRALDGPVRPGSFLGALARLEHHHLVERAMGSEPAMYRLTNYAPAPSS